MLLVIVSGYDSSQSVRCVGAFLDTLSVDLTDALKCFIEAKWYRLNRTEVFTSKGQHIL